MTFTFGSLRKIILTVLVPEIREMDVGSAAYKAIKEGSPDRALSILRGSGVDEEEAKTFINYYSGGTIELDESSAPIALMVTSINGVPDDVVEGCRKILEAKVGDDVDPFPLVGLMEWIVSQPKENPMATSLATYLTQLLS